jgi:hypothetical protein
MYEAVFAIEILGVTASLVRVLVVSATGATPGQMLLTASGWAAGGAVAGVPLGLLHARGLRR